MLAGIPLILYGSGLASDSRRVVSTLRVNRELEGLADLAENIAKRAKKLSKDPDARPFLPRLPDSRRSCLSHGFTRAWIHFGPSTRCWPGG